MRGFQGVRQTSKDLEARRGGSGLNALWFRLAEGEEAVVRFLEQDDDIFWCMMHEVPVDGRSFGRDVVCCNQDNDGTPCPGCEQGLPRRFKGFINVIWEDAPVFKRDADGKMVKDKDNNPIITGHKSQVAVWGSGIRVFEELDETNSSYRGLRSRKFKIKRRGSGLSTKYSIKPENIDGGPESFSSGEKELEKSKYDLNQFTKALTYDEFKKELGQGGGGGGNSDNDGGYEPPRNPFMRR